MNMQAQTFSSRWPGLAKLIARLFGDGDHSPAESIAKGVWSDSSRRVDDWRETDRLPFEAPQAAVNILVPIDFTAASFRALDCALRLARQAGGQVTLLHVVHLNLTPYGPGNPTWLKAALRGEAAAKADEIAANARASGVATACLIEEGAPAAVITNVAAQKQAGLIVMATPKRGPFARLFRQKTVEHVIRDVKCPVLVLQTNLKETIL